MNTKESLKARGDVSVVLTGPDGKVKQRQDFKNLVVNVGLAHIVSRMAGTAQNVVSHMALGSGATAVAATDTTLVTELGRVALTSATPNSAQISYAATFGAGTATGAVQEAALFNALVAGTMLARTKFNVVNKEPGDTLAITWTVTIAGT